jgi:hypothetical protein
MMLVTLKAGMLASLDKDLPAIHDFEEASRGKQYAFLPKIQENLSSQELTILSPLHGSLVILNHS